MQNNQIIKDDSSSRDQYYNNHVACIVVGNDEFYKNNLQIAKEQNKDVDQLVGTDFLFGKYLNFEANDEEWQQQLKELTAKLNDPKFANLKGIKFVLHEHGEDGKDRKLHGIYNAKPEYYKSKRFQDVAKIINDNFLSKSNENKLYFNNMACYGAYYFAELKENIDSSIPRSNHVYEILSNTFGKNRTQVYCSQLIPEIGIHMYITMNKNANPYRNMVSLAKDSAELPNKGEPLMLTDTYRNVIKKYYYEYIRLKVGEIITPPECKIYFPLEKFQSVVPNALCLKPNGPKEYRVDSKILENYTGKTAKDMKNNFLKWGEQPKYVKIYENQPFTISKVKYKNLSEYAKKNRYDYYQQCNEQFKQSQKESRRQYEKDQAITKSGYSLLDNQDRILDCHIF